MNNKRSWQLIFLLSFLSLSMINAQRDLKMVEDETTAILAGLGGSTSKVERASLTKEDERMVTISLTFSGFDDKSYRIKASALNKLKKPIEEISSFEADLPKSNQIDLILNLSDGGKTMAQQNIESKFLLVRVASKESGLTGLLEETIGDISLSGTDFLFELDKKWLLMGSNVKVNVKLVPYKNAASITPK